MVLAIQLNFDQSSSLYYNDQGLNIMLYKLNYFYMLDQTLWSLDKSNKRVIRLQSYHKFTAAGKTKVWEGLRHPIK